MKFLEAYEDKNAFRYGLKITSPFEDEFRLIVARGVEVIDVKPGTKEVILNDLKKSRLLVAHVHEGAEFEYIENGSPDSSGKSDIHIFLVGARASARISARYDLSDIAKLDILHKIYHQAPDTSSEIETRGVLRDKAYTIYRSDIVMEKGMKGLSGAEDAKFLVLSKEAKVDAIPSLDIASNDVACSHSLSITHITPEDLFYSKTRGIGESEARELLTGGFLN